MGLLDGGLQRVFGNVFRPFFLDGTIHKATRSAAEAGDGGSFSVAWADFPVKAMVNLYTDRQRASAGIGDNDVQIIVLQFGAGVVVTLDDEVTVRGVRYAIERVDQDPANAAWTLQGRPAA